LENKLRALIKEIKDGKAVFGSPVTDSLYSPVEKVASEVTVVSTESPGELAMAEDLEDEGFLDFLADMEESLNELTQLTIEFTDKTRFLGEALSQKAEEVAAAWSKPSQGTTSYVRKLARKSAEYINEYGTFVADRNKAYNVLWNKFEESVFALVISPLIGQVPGNIEAFSTFLDTMDDLKKMMSPAKESILTMSTSASGMQGIEKSITRASRVLDREIKIFGGLLDKSIATLERAIELGRKEIDRHAKNPTD
jgi:hypothetical protein